MAGLENLKPWQPGQSGNPAGSSRKARMRKLLRDFVREQLDAELVENLTRGEAIAIRIVDDALGDGARARKARDQILAMEPKSVATEQPEPSRSPEFIPTEDEQEALEDSLRWCPESAQQEPTEP